MQANKQLVDSDNWTLNKSVYHLHISIFWTLFKESWKKW